MSEAGDEELHRRDPMFGFVIGRRHYALSGTLKTVLLFASVVMLAGTAFAYGRTLLGLRTVSSHEVAIEEVREIAVDAQALSRRNNDQLQRLNAIVELQTVIQCLKVDDTSPRWLVIRCDQTLAASQRASAPVVPADVTDTSGRTR